MPILKVSHLAKIFTSGFWPFSKKQPYTAVNNISFELNKGEILGLLGPNGAGKTTTIQMLLGALTPTSGSIEYFNNSFAQKPIKALKRIGYASGYDKLPGRLTITENLDVIGRIYNISTIERKKQIENLLHVFQLWELKDQECATLSAGQATRVMLTKAFINNPEIVLLDEPTASLDPDVAQQVRTFIIEQSKQLNTAVLITSHNMEEVTELCDRVLVLKKGAIIANNTPEELARSISKVHVQLTISHELDSAIAYLHHAQVLYTQKNNNLTIEMDEHAIAPFLVQLSERKIIYSHISIDKPSLEDYFITIARTT